MSYTLDPTRMYRMPTHFGPSLGPRQGPDGRRFACTDNPHTVVRSVSFLTNRAQLDALLPERFRLAAEPVVTIRASYITDIEWLAGRGYNMIGVSFPAVFEGEQDRATGDFLAVLWENMTEPILTGRDELGYAKIYCEIPEPTVTHGVTRGGASWMGFHFMELQWNDLTPVPPERWPPAAAVQPDALTGSLHYRYVPRIGQRDTPDAAYATLTPAYTPNRRTKAMWTADGTVRFHHARWEDMPTQYTIVNTLAALEVKEYRGATIVESIGGKDLSDQRILR